MIIKKTLCDTINILRKLLVFPIAFSLVFQPIFYQIAFANPSNIIADGTTVTTTDLSANNTTIVNVATPNSSGTSINNFEQFNVDRSGVIINNSSVVANTQIGGWIYANPHLANGNQASVIVGEVTGRMPSNLHGYTEIAGGKAEFVLLNPNGISCEGCGFININSLTLGTGSGIYTAEGSLGSMKMGEGGFSVSGKGLDATLVDYFRVISKSIKLSGSIWAKDELAIYQGSSEFNTSSNTFSGSGKVNSGQTIGIDVSVLGAMYAGKATLIASDLGLGVNIASDVIASREGITITANGDIVYNNLSSATSISVVANNNGDIKQNGSLKSSNGDTKLSATRNINIAGGSIFSVGDTIITAGGDVDNSNKLSFATNNLSINAGGKIALQYLNAIVSRQVDITADNFFIANSNVGSAGNFTGDIKNTTKLNDTIITTNSDVNLITKDLTFVTSTLLANQVKINTSNNIVTTNSGINSNTLVLLNASNAITNANTKIKGITEVVINSTSIANTTGTLINSSGTLSINSASILNDGSQIYSAGNQNLITNDLTNLKSSIIYSEGVLNISNTGNSNLSSFASSGSNIYAAGDLTLKANIVTNSNFSLIRTLGELDIAAEVMDNKTNSQIFATRNTTIRAITLNNTGNSLIQSKGNLVKEISGDIIQDGSKSIAAGTITINANSLTNRNSALIQTTSGLNINIKSDLSNIDTSLIIATAGARIRGTTINNTTGSNIISGEGTNITANILTNTTSAGIRSNGLINIDSFSYTVNAGSILGLGSITANNLNNENGHLEAGGLVLITNNNFGLNNAGGKIQSNGGDTTINTNYQINNTSGEINSASDVRLNIKADQNHSETNSRINAGGGIYLNSKGYDIRLGEGVKFTTSKVLEVTGDNFTNYGDIKVGYISFKVENALINNANLVSTYDAQYISSKDIVNTGTIASGGKLVLQGENIINSNVGGFTGLIYSGGDMVVGGVKSVINNANSAVVTRGNLGIYAGEIISNRSNGQIYTEGNLTVGGYGSSAVGRFNNGSKEGAAYVKSAGGMQIYANEVNNIGKDNVELKEGSAYSVVSVSNGGLPGAGSSKIMYQEVVRNHLTSSNSQIIAGGGMLIRGNVHNETGDILAGGNLMIEGNVVNNVTRYTTRLLHERWVNVYKSCWFAGVNLRCRDKQGWWDEYNSVILTSLTPSRIAAGGNLIIKGRKVSNDSGMASYQDNTALGSSSGGVNAGYGGSYATSFVNASNLNSNNLSAPSINMNALSNPSMFSISANRASLSFSNAKGESISFTYMYESNPVFRRKESFLSSEYFFKHLEYAPSRQIVMIGDPYTERRIIEDTLARSGMVQHLGNGSIDVLYANGLKYLEGKRVEVGHELSAEQIEGLEEDMIIPVAREIGGKVVMVPQVYYGGKSVGKARDMDKAGGQLVAGGVIGISVEGDIVNKGYMGSGGNMLLAATESVINMGGELKAEGSMLISGNNVLFDVLVDNSVRYVRKKGILGVMRGRVEEVGEKNEVQNVSKIEAGGSMVIRGGKDVIGKGVSIRGVEGVDIEAGGEVKLGAGYSESGIDIGEFRESGKKSVNSIVQTGREDATDKLINKAENDKRIEGINVGLGDMKERRGYLEKQIDGLKKKNEVRSYEDSDGNVTRESTKEQLEYLERELRVVNGKIGVREGEIRGLKERNREIIGSIRSKSGGDVRIVAGGDIKVEAGVDSRSTYNYSSQKDFTGSRTEIIEKDSKEVLSSLVSGRNVEMVSGRDVEIVASIVSGGGRGRIVAGGDVRMEALENMYYESYLEQKTKIDLGALALQLAVVVAVSAVTAGVGGAIMGVAGAAAAGATSGAIGVGSGYAIGIVSSGLEGGTEQIQSGGIYRKVTSSRTLVTSNIMFGESFEIGVVGKADIGLANIEAKNIKQEVWGMSKSMQSSSYTELKADYKGIVKGAVISGVIAGAMTVAGKLIQPTAEVAKTEAVYKPHDSIAKKTYNGVVDPTANNLMKSNLTNIADKVGKPVTEAASSMHEGSWFSRVLNKIPGANSASVSHDMLTTKYPILDNHVMLLLTIPPVFAFNYAALYPWLAASAPDAFISVGSFGTVNRKVENRTESFSLKEGNTTSNVALWSN